MITIILAIVIAGALLSSKDAQQLGRRFFHRLVGDGGDKVIELTTKTVSSVVRGVIGVALIQTILIGLGFLGIGLPYAGVWTLNVLILAVLQLPPTTSGVVAVSTGNHGRALAYSARAAGVPCIICMSKLVPDNKLEAIRALGAEARIIGKSVREAGFRSDHGLHVLGELIRGFDAARSLSRTQEERG